MRQIVQHLDTGETEIVTAPAPVASPGTVLIRTRLTLISAGTERMLVGFAKASLIRKAAQQPERVKDVLNKVRTDGLLTTIDAVRSKLGQPLALGYSNVGEVIEVGAGVQDFAVGDRVLSNGPHADIVRVPRNLCAPIPDGVTDEQAVFGVVGAIGLQGIRLLAPTLGETVAVIGTGLIGLLAVEMLVANGCAVLAIDFDEAKLAIARTYGAATCNLARGENPVEIALGLSGGKGIDGVLIAASTDSDDPVRQAAAMCRKRGRIVLVGVTGLTLNRADFYEKELSFQVSCSYGPGRYDPEYEERGRDYPIGFVRWTEGRNFSAVLDLIQRGKLDPGPLISGKVAFSSAQEAFARLADDKSGLGQLIEYDRAEPLSGTDQLARRTELVQPATPRPGQPVLGVIGGGNYASRMLIPALVKGGAQLRTIGSSGGLSAALTGRRFGFGVATTDVAALLDDPQIDTAVIATRHDSHADLAIRALGAGKHVFVEKPLALSLAQVGAIEAAWRDAAIAGPTLQLMVGFNRRFAPLIRRMKGLLSSVAVPKAFVMVMNAGHIPPNHWTQDPVAGGGRIIGEACHLIDLMRYLAGSAIVSVQTIGMGPNPNETIREDKAAIGLRFADGSFGTVHYLANGAASFPKERIEVFAGGRVLQLDNYRKLTGFGWPGFSNQRSWRADKGQAAMAEAFLGAIRTGRPAIEPGEIFEVARISIEASRQLQLA